MAVPRRPENERLSADCVQFPFDRSSCASSTVASGNTCNFYDITTDTNAVPCIPGTLNCTVAHSGDTVAIIGGYNSGTGFDLTTGLGSVNAKNLVTNWASVARAPAVSLTPTALTFASTAVGSTTAAQVVTIKNTGTATLKLTSETITGTMQPRSSSPPQLAERHLR